MPLGLKEHRIIQLRNLRTLRLDDSSTIARPKEIVSFAEGNEIRIGLKSSQNALVCTDRPLEVSGGGSEFTYEFALLEL